MKLESLVLAEGMGQDANGAYTLIGVNQNVFSPQSLPAGTKRAVLAYFVEEPGENLEWAGKSAEVSFTVTSPTGKVLAAQTGQLSFGEKNFADVPVALQLPNEIILQVREYGDHRIAVAVTFPDESVVKGELTLYVRPFPG